MVRGTQLRAIEQRERVKKYLRTLRANYNRAYRERSQLFRIRKGCPFELSLRSRRVEDANGLFELAEKCLAEINHCYALRLAPFQPGAHVLVTTTLRGFPPNPRRYLVLDVEWCKRDEYTYIAHELTKHGLLHKGRFPMPLCPSNRISIEKCEEPLPPETLYRADTARRDTAALMDAVLEKGELSLFAPTQAHAPLLKPTYIGTRRISFY